MSSRTPGGGDEAADVVMKEIEKTKKEREKVEKDIQAPKMEKVMNTMTEDQMKAMDDSELDRRSREMQEKLEKREVELRKQAKRLEKLKHELKAIEAPMKKEILEIRTGLEEVNRKESSTVAQVNQLRQSLFDFEKELADIRTAKGELSEKLISVMADYEKRKMERLNELAEVVGDKPPQPEKKDVGFGGF